MSGRHPSVVMKRLVAGLLVVSAPSLAMAHVSVRPRESKPGAEERYTVRVPTEGSVATTHVVLEIPADVTVLEVLAAEGASFEAAKQGDRITSITWKKQIPPKEAAEFVFRARNPSSTEIVWKAHQHFSDGTTADWVGAPGERRPASVTKLGAAAVAATTQAGANEAAAIEAWLKEYDAAFNAKDLDNLATFYHSDVAVYEGRGINNGWVDYRDRHLGPDGWRRSRVCSSGTATSPSQSCWVGSPPMSGRSTASSQDGDARIDFLRAGHVRADQGRGWLKDPPLAYVQPATPTGRWIAERVIRGRTYTCER